MATRRFWIGTTGPYLYDDTEAAFRFETAAGTVGVNSLAGFSAASVDIDGGTIDGTPIGATSPDTGSFTTLAVDHITLEGATANCSFIDSGFAGATELAWLQVQVGTTTGYIRIHTTV
jgi:hypothetical protein